MSSQTGAFSWGTAKLRWMRGGNPRPWRPVWSEAAARRAVRATIVLPGLFALTLEGFGNLQMALFAAFGSFATLVFVSFGGTARDKLLAHLGLAVAGSVLLVIGTVVSGHAVVAAIATVPVAFAVFFAGAFGPNPAAGVTGALLAYVLPAASAGTLSMVPDRLAGWWLASVVGTAAVLVLPAPSVGDRVGAAAAKLAGALAGVLDAALHERPTQVPLTAALEAKNELLSAFNATPFRPTGLSVRDQSLAQAVELLEWCTLMVADAVRERTDLRQASEADRDLLAATMGVLRDSSLMFTDPSARLDLDGLDRKRKARLARLQSGWSAPPKDGEDARLAFHVNAIAGGALAVGGDLLVAARRARPDEIAAARARRFDADKSPRRSRLATLSQYSGIALSNASIRSVWFVNSLRGSLALAAAVAVAEATSVQHGFWVVLGTLSVLRTSASATGATALRALLGTVIGFVIGGALLIAIGSSNAALWAVLPLAVLIAAYSPGTASFAVGQAAFTVTVAVLFNLLVPVGWKVGEVRVEDVALGCVVSVVVGALFWPRGAGSVVADDLADAYRTGASHLRDAIDWVLGRRTEAPTTGRPAARAALRLDAAVRAFLTEQGTKQLKREELWRLIGGTLRLRLTGVSVADLPHACANPGAHFPQAIEEQTEILVGWYRQLAGYVGRPRRELAPLVRLGSGDLGESSVTSDARPDDTRGAIWLEEYLDHLTEHVDDLIGPATHLAQIRRQPWWR